MKSSQVDANSNDKKGRHLDDFNLARFHVTSKNQSINA